MVGYRLEVYCKKHKAWEGIFRRCYSYTLNKIEYDDELFQAIKELARSHNTPEDDFPEFYNEEGDIVNPLGSFAFTDEGVEELGGNLSFIGFYLDKYPEKIRFREVHPKTYILGLSHKQIMYYEEEVI